MAGVPTVEQLYESGQKLAEPKEDVSKVSWRALSLSIEGHQNCVQLCFSDVVHMFLVPANRIW